MAKKFTGYKGTDYRWIRPSSSPSPVTKEIQSNSFPSLEQLRIQTPRALTTASREVKVELKKKCRHWFCCSLLFHKNILEKSEKVTHAHYETQHKGCMQVKVHVQYSTAAPFTLAAVSFQSTEKKIYAWISEATQQHNWMSSDTNNNSDKVSEKAILRRNENPLAKHSREMQISSNGEQISDCQASKLM